MWVRRLYTCPDGRDLVAMDSRRRLFGGLLRRMLVLRDDVCTTAWCEAPIVHADHTTPVREDGRTTFEQGSGKCARCNQGKEAPGWRTRVIASQAGRVVQVTTPLGHRYTSQPPPLLGWGSEHPASQRDREPADGPPKAPATPHRRKRARGRKRSSPVPPRQRRPRATSHLERQLCRYLS